MQHAFKIVVSNKWIVGSLHKLAAPESLDFLDKAAGLPAHTDLADAKPGGLMDLVGALSDPNTDTDPENTVNRGRGRYRRG